MPVEFTLPDILFLTEGAGGTPQGAWVEAGALRTSFAAVPLTAHVRVVAANPELLTQARAWASHLRNLGYANARSEVANGE